MTKLFGANQFDSVEFKMGRYQRFYIGPDRQAWFRWDTTGVQFNATSANTIIRFGASGAGMDAILYGDTADRDVRWDQSRDQLLFLDNATLGIGGAANAAADIAIAWDATRLNVTPAAGDSVWRFGSAAANLDVEFLAPTAASAATATWDASAYKLVFAGNSTASAAPRLRIMADAVLTGAQRRRGDLFLVSNTTGLYIAVMRNSTVSSGLLMNASTW